MNTRAPTYRKGNRQPDTRQEGVGLVDWAGAQRSGTGTAIAISDAVTRQSKMNAETEGVLMENAMSKMALKEEAVHHGAMMEFLATDKGRAQMQDVFATKAAAISDQRIIAERKLSRTRQREGREVDFQTATKSHILGLAANTFKTKDPADAYGIYLELERDYPASTAPEILEAKAGMKEIFGSEVEGLAAQANQAEGEEPGSFERTLLTGVENFAGNAKPRFQELITQALSKDVKRWNTQNSRARAGEYQKKVDGEISEGASEEQAIRSVANKNRLYGLGLGHREAQEEHVARWMEYERGQYESKLSAAEGFQDGRGINQYDLSHEIGLATRKRDELKISDAKRSLELSERVAAIKSGGIPDVIGGSTLSQLSKRQLHGSRRFTWSNIQDSFMIDIDTRIADIDTRIDSGSTKNAADLINRRKRLVDLKKEMGWGGKFFHKQKFKDTTGPVMSAVKGLHKATLTYRADQGVAAQYFDEANIALNDIYQLTGSELERINYEMKAMKSRQGATQSYIDELSSYKIDAPSSTPRPLTNEGI